MTNDIIIRSSSHSPIAWCDSSQSLRDRIRDWNVKFKLYLGTIISEEGIKAGPAKVYAISNMQIPTDKAYDAYLEWSVF